MACGAPTQPRFCEAEPRQGSRAALQTPWLLEPNVASGKVLQSSLGVEVLHDVFKRKLAQAFN